MRSAQRGGRPTRQASHSCRWGRGEGRGREGGGRHTHAGGKNEGRGEEEHARRRRGEHRAEWVEWLHRRAPFLTLPPCPISVTPHLLLPPHTGLLLVIIMPPRPDCQLFLPGHDAAGGPLQVGDTLKPKP